MPEDDFLFLAMGSAPGSDATLEDLICGHDVPRAGMVMRGSGPNLESEREGSVRHCGFPDPI
ncbi:hypothetical protein [Mesorhizobium sp.]|uniref:hypothetical protein n=1 Tax=Mesorhizobium sp. TaxID=1871066 RepID=UPI0025D8EC0B|nr:hypothetical protein [Mesorhizobium sp.]